MGNFVAHLSEFMSPEALEFYSNKKEPVRPTKASGFCSLLAFPKKDQPCHRNHEVHGAALEPV